MSILLIDAVFWLISLVCHPLLLFCSFQNAKLEGRVKLLNCQTLAEIITELEDNHSSVSCIVALHLWLFI